MLKSTHKHFDHVSVEFVEDIKVDYLTSKNLGFPN